MKEAGHDVEHVVTVGQVQALDHPARPSAGADMILRHQRALRPYVPPGQPFGPRRHPQKLPAGLAVAPAGSGYRLAVTESDPLAARYTSQAAQGSHIRSMPAAPRRDHCRPRNEP
jgi:hypothetical protein